MTRYVSPRTRKRSPILSASKKSIKTGGKKNKTRRQTGGSSIVSVLKTAILPFLFYKAQKTQQRRVIRNKTKKRRLRR